MGRKLSQHPDRAALHSLESPHFADVLGRVVDALLEPVSTIAAAYVAPGRATLGLCIRDRTAQSASASWNAARRRYEIGLNLGLCVWAYEAATWMAWFAANDHQDLRFNAKRLRAFGPLTTKRQLQARLSLADAIFEDRERGFSDHLIFSILVNVVLHEAAHILRGHIDLVMDEQKDELGLIDELAMRTADAPRLSVPLRTLEYEADVYAAAFVNEVARSHDLSRTPWRNQETDHNLIFALFGLALFTIGVAEAVGDPEPGPDSYPTPFLRLAVALTQLRTNWERIHPERSFDENVTDRLVAVLATMETLFPGVDHFRAFNEDGWQEGLVAEMMEMTGDYDRVSPTLAPYRFKPAS